MKNSAPSTVYSRRLGGRAVWLLTLVTLAGCHFKTEEERDKEYFDHQVAAIREGNGDTLYFYDVNGTDALLQSISGMHGVKYVVVESMNDITDAGIKEIASLPDLKSLALYELPITDHRLKLLQSSPQLEELDLTPYAPFDFVIATVLALPHLRKLHLDIAVYPDDAGADDVELWVDSVLQGLSKANSLQELRLTGDIFVKRKKDLARLQQELPGCEIKLAKAQGKGDPPLIPLTDDE